MAGKALSSQMNRVVKVNRLKLIETLKQNRDKHVKDFKEAMAGYKDIALQKVEDAFKDLSSVLDKRKKDMVEHISSFSPETSDKFSDSLTILQGITISLKVPMSYSDAYDAAIDMAEFDVRDELELNGAEFQCFCRDVWDWSYEFSNTKNLYSK